MSLFGKVKRIINESKILLEKDSDALKQFKKSKKSFEKGFGKSIKPTVVQPGLDLYKAGGPYIPDKTTFADSGKKVPKMEPKPQFGKPKTTTTSKTGAPDRSLLKSTIKNVKDSERRLFQKGLGKGTAGVKGVKGKKGISLARQRKYTKEIIKDLSAKTTQSDARVRGSSTEGSAGASSSSKTVTPTKTVKQSEQSKKAKDFTDRVNKERRARLNKASDNITQSRDNLITQRETLRSVKGKKDTDKIRSVNRQVKAYDKLAQTTKKAASGAGNPNAPVVYNKLTAGDIKSEIKTTKNQKNKSVNRRNRNYGTSKTATGNNRVTTGMGRGVGSGTRVTANKDYADFAKDFNNKSNVNRNSTSFYKSQGKDAFDLRKNPIKTGSPSGSGKKIDLPKFSKSSGVTNPSFMKKVMPKMRKAATPAAKAFSKAGPIGKLAGAALLAGGAIYGANQIRKAFAGAGKPKAPPAVKGSALRYTSGPKKGQKKYFDIKTMKKKYFTDSDFRDMNPDSKTYGQVDADKKQFTNKGTKDYKLQQKLRSTK